MPRKNVAYVRMNDQEYKILETLEKFLDVSKSEAIRHAVIILAEESELIDHNYRVLAQEGQGETCPSNNHVIFC
jgi:hypothetical protein